MIGRTGRVPAPDRSGSDLRRSSEGGGLRRVVLVLGLGACLFPLVGAILVLGRFAVGVRV